MAEHLEPDLFGGETPVAEVEQPETKAGQPAVTALDQSQPLLFSEGELPEAPKNKAVQKIYVHFETREDLLAFGKLLGIHVTSETRYLRFPLPTKE